MLAYLEERISLRTVIWLFPLAFILHDAEEIFTIPSWMEQNRAALLAIAGEGSFVSTAVNSVSLTTAQMTGAVLFELLLCMLASWAGVRALRAGKLSLFFTVPLTVLFANVFTHAGQTVIFGAYTPGVITAVIFALPYCLYAYHRLFRAELMTWRLAGASLALGAAVALPVVLTAHSVGRFLFPN